MLPEDTLNQIADELSHLTGEHWVAVHVAATEQEIELWEIRAEDGRAIRYRTVWNHLDRVAWYGAYGRTKRGTKAYFGGEVSDDITTGVTRAPKTIAADLVRRLLPTYTTRFKTAQQQTAAEDARQDRIADEVVQLVAAGARMLESSREESVCYLEFDGGMSGTVVPIGDGAVNLNMSHVPLAAALMLIHELKKGTVS